LEDCLKLQNQLCFPLYAASKEVVRRYKPILEEFDLTYTQYIAMMILWEKKTVTVNKLGEHLYLDSGTLTPMLKKMENKGLIKRTRSELDERRVNVELTAEGERLSEAAVKIPEQMSVCLKLSEEEKRTLYNLLYKIINTLDDERKQSVYFAGPLLPYPFLQTKMSVLCFLFGVGLFVFRRAGIDLRRCCERVASGRQRGI
jgi:DNA-binding MarR family transcriptional regulator